MCKNWGYSKLHEAVEKRAIDEMKHAEELIGRILFLEGTPIAKAHGLKIGNDVPAQLQNDWDAEFGAVKSYNEGIALCAAQADNGSKMLLEAILKDEEDHIDWLEAQKDQIAQMGLQIYLGQQL
jgi:bacterioferritin